MFNTSNSGRAVVKGSADWKSRKLDLGNRHRTTLNFGDLVPGYWQHVQPGDKLRVDASILAKFMPLIAPAFSRMKIKTEWFFVPLRQIAEPTLRALQDFKPDPADMNMYFSSLVSEGFTNNVPTSAASDNQQVNTLKGFFTIPANLINAYLVGDTATIIRNNGVYSSVGSDYTTNQWRNPGGVISGLDIPGSLGQENIASFTSKKRISKFLSYLGLPSRLTQMRYTIDAVFDFNNNYGYNLDVVVDNAPQTPDFSYMSKRYFDMTFGTYNFGSSPTSLPQFSDYKAAAAYALSGFPASFNTSDSSITLDDIPVDANGRMIQVPPVQTTYSSAAISAIPAQAYQKIFNDFYRDEKLQPEEIRYFPSWIRSSQFEFSDTLTGNVELSLSSPLDVYKTVYEVGNIPSRWTAFFNNLFGLRRRNRTKDVISSCVTSQVVKGQLNVSTNETVYDAKLQSRLARYFMKKEFTGSTWAEWLSNFFGVNSNDLLNNNVVFLGGKESVVSISENIQQSESTQDSAQGNRAGLANDFHSGSEIYFRCPDFGVIMCIVSVIPDDIDNFNGLTERFQRNSPFDFNLKDFQNIGFAPVFNRRVNIGFADSANLSATLPAYPSELGDRAHSDANSVFGWQPYGYGHTYTPNVISGDFESSLRFWHQSPDLDFDFTAPSSSFGTDPDGNDIVALDYDSWVANQLQLNFNLPAVGLRFQPYGADLKSQYYNNVFAVTNDESGDHIVADMRFAVSCHRETAFFTDAIDS